MVRASLGDQSMTMEIFLPSCPMHCGFADALLDLEAPMASSITLGTFKEGWYNIREWIRKASKVLPNETSLLLPVPWILFSHIQPDLGSEPCSSYV